MVLGPFECVWERQPKEEIIHIWLGPLGAHIFWPDIWHSRPDWLGNRNALP